MNEREAIEFIMEEIKEQRRADHDMYFEMRKNTTDTYNRFLDRLRELDDKEREERKPLVIEKPTLTSPEMTKEEESGLRTLFKQLPVARHMHVTPQEMNVDRIREETSFTKNLVPDEVIVPAVEQYLENTDGWVGSRHIKMAMESKFGVEWTNFSNVMERVMDFSPLVEVDKSGKRYLYRYKEVNT